MLVRAARICLALRAAEAHLEAGVSTHYAVLRAATSHDIDAGELRTRLLEKLAACHAARRVLAHDAEVERNGAYGQRAAQVRMENAARRREESST